MAGNNRIHFDVDFNVKRESLKSLQLDLDKIAASLDFAKAGKGGIKLTNELKQAGEMAKQLSAILGQSFNKDLGTLNITKFNNELAKSGVTLSQVKSQLEGQGTAGAAAYNKLANSILSTNIQLKESNKLLNSMAETMANTVKWGIASSILNTMTNSIKQAYNYSVQLDTSLNDIRIVTGDSADQMQRFAEQANSAAQKLGSTTLDYTKTALGFYQQGLGDEAVAERTEATIKAANVTGTQASQTAEYLTAVWNGFKAEIGSEVEYVDKLAAVADSSASNLAELATAMSKTASVANNMGVNMDQLTAQVATIIATTRQAPETVGNALKTIYARINDIKTGSDEAEVSLGNYTKIMAQLGYNVLDSTGHLRDTGEVMQEIGDNWANMTREQQIYLAQTMAGKRQMNNLVALFDNWTMYSDMLNTSLEAQGALDEKNNRYLESTKAHLNELKTATQDLYSTLINTNEVNTTVDVIRNLVQVLDGFLEGFGGGLKSITAFGTLVAYVFREQIGNAIVQAQSNYDKFQETLINLRSREELLANRTADGTSNRIQDQAELDALRERLNIEEQIQQVRSGLSQEELQEAIRLEDIVAKETQRLTILNDELLELQKNVGIEGEISAKNIEIINEKLEQDGLREDEKQDLQRIRDLVYEIQDAEENRTNANRSLGSAKKGEESGLLGAGVNKKAIKDQTQIITSSLMMLTMTWGTVSSIIKTVTDENATALEKMSRVMMSVGSAIPMLIFGYNGLATALGTVGQGLQATAVAWWQSTAAIRENTVALLTNPYFLAGAAIIAIIYGIAKAYDAQTDAAKKATQAAIDAKDRAEEVKDAYNELKTSLDNLVSGEETLASLTQGTLEWKEAVVDLNNQVLTLLQNYPELAEYVNNDKGYLSLDEGAYDVILEKQQKEVEAAQSIAFAEQKRASMLQRRADAQALGREVGQGGRDADIDKILQVADFINSNATQLDGTLEENAKTLSEATGVSEKVATELLQNTDALIALNASAEGIKTIRENQARALGQQNNDYLNSNYQQEIDSVVAGQIAKSENLIEAKVDGMGLQSEEELAARYKALTGLVWDKEKITRDELEYLIAETEVHQQILDGMSQTVSAVENMANSAEKIKLDSGRNEAVSGALASFSGGEGGSLSNLSAADIKTLLSEAEGDGEFGQAIADYATTLGYESKDAFINALKEAQTDWDQEFSKIGTKLSDSIQGVYKKVTDGVENITLDQAQMIGDILQGAFNQGATREAAEGMGQVLEIIFGEGGIGALDDIDWQNITPEQLAEHLKELGVETPIANDVLQMLINSMREMAEVEIDPRQQRKELMDVVGGIGEDKIVDEEGIAKLQEAGVNIDKYFIDMLDGTYKLKGTAEEFKNTINDLTLSPFVQELDELQQKTQLLQNLQDNGFEPEQFAGEQTDISARANQSAIVGQFIDEQNVLDAREYAEIQDKILHNQELTTDEVKALGDAYDQLKPKLSDLDEQIAKNTERAAELKESLLMNEERDSDIDTEAMENMADYLQENREAIGGLSEDLEEHDSIATDVAESILRFDDAIQDVTDNYDDWMSALESGNIQDNAEAMEGLRDAYGDMLDIDGGALSSDFLTNAENLELMKQAAEGSTDAYDELMARTQEDILAHADLDQTAFDAASAELQGTLDELNFQDLEIGANLDTGNALAQMTNLVNAAGMTAAQAEAYLASMGIDAEVVTQNKPTQETKQQVGWNAEWEPAEAKAKIPIVSGVGTDAQSIGSQTITFQSQSLRYSPNEETVKTTQDNMATSLKVIGAHKSSGGGIKFKNASNGGGNGSRKGGGGGGKKPKKGGGSKGKEYKAPKKKETKKDPYAKVNRQLKQVDRNLKELTQTEKKLTGQKYLDNLKKQNKELEKQLKYTKEKNDIARKEVERQQKQLAKTGLNFSADGEITNYLAMWDKYNRDLENLYKKATGKGATEADKARYEKAVEDFEKWEKQVADYNKDLDIFKDTYNEYNDIIDEMVQNNIDRFKYKIDLKLDTTDFEKDWKKFRAEILKGVKDDDYVNLNFLNLSTMNDDLQAAKSTLTQIEKMQTALKASQKIQDLIAERDNPKTSDKRRAAINKEIAKLSDQTPYYDNVAQLEEDMKKYMEEAMKRGEDIADAVEDIHDNWMDAIDDAQEAFDKQLEQYESINELIEHNLDLVELLHGNEAYEEMSKLYDKQAENTLKAAADSKKQQDFWRQMMNTVDKGSDAWNEYKKNWEDAVSETNKLTVESAKLFKEQYDAAIQGIGKALKDNLMGGDAYKTGRNWENMLGDSDRYLDTLDRGNNMLALYNKGQDMMMNRTAKQQKELQKLMNSQTKNLENQTELRQIDFEIAQAELDLLEKRWALEDARNNKTKMRLRRDSQGNYRYQYVVDEDAVNKAQQEYMDALADLRAKELEDYKDTASRFADAYEDYLERVNEIREQYAGDEAKINAEIQAYEKEWLARNQKLVNDYDEMSRKVVDINGTMFNSLAEQMSEEQLQKAMGVSDAIFGSLKKIYQPDGEIVSMVDGFASDIFKKSFDAIPQKTKEALQEVTGLIPQVFGDVLNSDNWKNQVQNATKQITKAITNESNDLDRLATTVNQNFDNLVNNLNSTVTLSQTFLSNQQTLNDIYEDQLEVLRQQDEAANSVLNTFRAYANSINLANDVGRYINRNEGTNNSQQFDSEYIKSAGSGYDSLAEAIYYSASKAEGGSTGSWAGGKGKFAVLHADEYVLTEQDTKNVLNSINIAEALAQQISALQTGMLGNIGGAVNFSKIFGEEGNSSLFDQNVVINADFPAVESAREIKQAFDELVNMASQKVSKNRRVY